MKLIRVKVDQFKVLKDVDIDVNGRNVLIMGDNEVGKSSLIQFIQILLGDIKKIPPYALGKGMIVFDKDGKEYKLNATISEGKVKIKLTGPDGMKDDRKGVLYNLIGAVDFDINEFVAFSKTEAGRKKQIEKFRQLLPQEIQDGLNEFYAKIRTHFEDRATINKKIEELKGSCRSNPFYGVRFEGSHIDISELNKELQAANHKNTTISDVQNRQKSRLESIKEKEEKIQRMKAELAAAEMEVQGLVEQRDAADKYLAENPMIDTTEIVNRMNSMEANNENVRQYNDLKQKEKQIEKLEEESGDYTALIESQRQAIRDTIQSMDSPINGLEFDEEMLRYQGIPVHPDSMSESQIMRLGCLLKFAENPDLKLLFLHGTESFGKKRWEEIQEMCKENDWRFIAEKVDSSKEKLTIEMFN